MDLGSASIMATFMTWSTYPWVRPKKGHSPHQDFRMEQLQHQQTRISIEFHRYPPVWFMKLWKGFTAEFLPIGETTSQPWLSTAELKALLRIIWIRPVANSHPTHCLGLQTFFVPDQRFCARLAVCLIEVFIWLVVLTILKNMKVNGKDYPIYDGK